MIKSYKVFLVRLLPQTIIAQCMFIESIFFYCLLLLLLARGYPAFCKAIYFLRTLGPWGPLPALPFWRQFHSCFHQVNQPISSQVAAVVVVFCISCDLLPHSFFFSKKRSAFEFADPGLYIILKLYPFSFSDHLACFELSVLVVVKYIRWR